MGVPLENAGNTRDLLLQGRRPIQGSRDRAAYEVHDVLRRNASRDSDNALVELAKDLYMGPRCSKFPGLLPKFLKAAGLQADVVFAVSMLKRKQQGVGSDDGAATTKYTFLGKEYGHGKETNCPSYYVCHIIDLYNDSYNDNKGLYPPINKKEKADKKGPIPDEFGEYNGVVYKSDRPEPPDYKGRGGLGYGPDSPRKIENTYGP